jgi:hypothetical protein
MDDPSLPDLGAPDVPDCPECGTPFVRTLVRFDYGGQFFGYFPADVCARGHEFLTDESDEAIEQMAKKMGLFGSGALRGRARTRAKAG